LFFFVFFLSFFVKVVAFLVTHARAGYNIHNVCCLINTIPYLTFPYLP
jgi:hypothetical protein